MKKALPIMILLLLLTSTITLSGAMVSNPTEDPQITDASGDAFGYLDIVSILFYEKEDTPDFLYVQMNIDNPSEFKFQQTFAVFWKHKGTQYSCGLFVGFSVTEWKKFDAGLYEFERDQQDQVRINGSYNFETGAITWKIPKDIIGDPQPRDVLSDTWSNAFRRVGLIGRMGFTRYVIDAIILQVFRNSMWDYAPERGQYGSSYEIQY